jgi:hypothetical protein
MLNKGRTELIEKIHEVALEPDRRGELVDTIADHLDCRWLMAE